MPEIAERLNRRIQSVASVLKAGQKKTAIPTGQPTAVTETSAGTMPAGASPDAEEPVAAVAVPDTGHASAAAPEAGGAASDTPLPLTARQREITDHLSRLGYGDGFDPELDLEIAEGFAGGVKAAQLALDLDVDGAALIRRYRQMTLVIRDDRDRMSPERQVDLLQVLRLRLARARAKGAA